MRGKNGIRYKCHEITVAPGTCMRDAKLDYVLRRWVASAAAASQTTRAESSPLRAVDHTRCNLDEVKCWKLYLLSCCDCFRTIVAVCDNAYTWTAVTRGVLSSNHWSADRNGVFDSSAACSLTILQTLTQAQHVSYLVTLLTSVVRVYVGTLNFTIQHNTYCTRTDLAGNINTVVPNVRSFRHYILPLIEEKTHEAASTIAD